MKTVKILTILLLAFCLMFWHVEVSAEPMGTAFTYQGRLLDANGPSDGMYDFQFKLYDNANVIDGNQVGSDVNVPDVDVIDGYFTVVLEFGCDVFNGDARWLEIEVRQADSNEPNDFITLSPRQEVTPTPYALQTRGIFVDGFENVGIGTDIPFERLEVDNGNLLVQGIGSFDSDDEEAFVYLGDNNHYIKSGWGFGVSIGTWEVDPGIVVRETTGHVGIGTIDPQKNLSIQATRPQIALVENGGDAGILEFHEQENQLRLQYWTDYGSTWNTTMMTLDGDTGNVGIGADNPLNDLHVYDSGGDAYVLTESENNYAFYIADGHKNSGLTMKEDGTLKANVYWNTASQCLSLAYGNDDSLVVKSRNVGIGTTNPQAGLHIKGNGWPNSFMYLEGNAGKDAGIRLYDGATAKWHVFNHATQDALWIYNSDASHTVFYAEQSSGNVGIGTASPGAKLHVAGMARVEAVQITGADVAEKFPVSEEVKPGMVVTIDKENQGQLCISRGEYNRCVAGVVSGANSLPTGAVLGNLPGHEDAVPIALNGRVWVYCDSTEKGIEPGDMLTTSSRAGHAMAVTDYTKAHGAVLGKAMTSLEKGQTGLVLTLINLQ